MDGTVSLMTVRSLATVGIASITRLGTLNIQPDEDELGHEPCWP